MCASISRMQVKCVVAEASDLRAAIDRFHRADGELSTLSSVLEEEVGTTELVRAESEPKEDDAPIVRFVNLLISQAIQDLASDIHIEPGEFDLGVRYRIDGVMHEMQRAPKNIQNGVISRLKIMADIDIAERRKPQDGRLSVSHGGRMIDLRVATLPTVWGEKVVMRILDNSATGIHMADLGLLPHNFERYRALYSKPYGMILVTGPTGSGKSTTLYTTLTEVARPEINVITVEDPVEYRMAGINQVQVNPKAGLTFASALRSILRSDPDVVLLGEIRDHETAQIAIEASLTGHLVLSTLHTNDAPSAVTRLTEMDIEPFLVGFRARLRGRPAARPPPLRAVPGAVRPRPGRARSARLRERARWMGRAPALPAARLPELFEHRLPRAHRDPRGDAGHRGHRAADGCTRIQRGDRQARDRAGDADPAPGRLGEGAAGHHLRRRSVEGRRMSSHGAQPVYEIPVTAPQAGPPGAPPPSGEPVYGPPPVVSPPGADPALIAALQEVVLAGASDLHISANAAPMLRIDGRLAPIGMPWERHTVTSALYSIMSEQQREEFEAHPRAGLRLHPVGRVARSA